ncbi:MAG: DUF429 domain-containing protein, partial [Pseudomonadota bacterium]
MIVLGIDFTSAPSAKKPITLARCTLDGTTLTLERVQALVDFRTFEFVLAEPGPWIAGLDFPFGQTRAFVEAQDWPLAWADYVARVADLSSFFEVVKAFEAGRPAGAKQPRRRVDRLTGGQPPQKVQWQPVGLMFARGAPLLLASGVHLPLLHETGDDRVAVEAYPAVLARHLIGRTPYKAETGDTAERRDARTRIVEALADGRLLERYGVTVALSEAQAEDLVADAKGDRLDAVLCAVQAAWASRQRRYGMPDDADSVEGWIADPHTREASPIEPGYNFAYL